MPSTNETARAKRIARMRQWRHDNRDELLARRRAHRRENRDAINAARRAARRANPNREIPPEAKQKLAEYHRAYRAKHKEKIDAYMRRYYREHRDAHLAKMREWRTKNAAEISAKKRAKNQDPAEKLRARARAVKFRMKSYGITHADHAAMLSAQGGLCAIRGCGRSATDVDHDHKTGRVRALLCRACNLALGSLGECRKRAAGLMEYMEVHDCVRRETAFCKRRNAVPAPTEEVTLFA